MQKVKIQPRKLTHVELIWEEYESSKITHSEEIAIEVVQSLDPLEVIPNLKFKVKRRFQIEASRISHEKTLFKRKQELNRQIKEFNKTKT